MHEFSFAQLPPIPQKKMCVGFETEIEEEKTQKERKNC